MESGQSGRADGRGWGGRGDSGAGRGASRGDAPRRSRGPENGGDRRHHHDERTPPPRRPEAPLPPEDDLLHGPEESPWVRFADPGQRPGEGPGAHRAGPPLPDLSALLVVLEGMRGMVPRELSAQLNALVRELLLTLRALIDWYLERLDGPPREPEVEEIPID